MEDGNSRDTYPGHTLVRNLGVGQYGEGGCGLGRAHQLLWQTRGNLIPVEHPVMVVQG